MSLRERLDGWVPLINMVAFLLIVAVGLGTVVNTRTNAAQDRAAVERADEQAAANSALLAANSAFLKCVDRWATDLSEGQPAVRAATKRRDDAQRERDDAFGAVFIEFQTILARRALGLALGPRNFAPSLEALDVYKRADRALDRASVALDVARRRYPYPAPPSTVCRNGSPAPAGE